MTPGALAVFPLMRNVSRALARGDDLTALDWLALAAPLLGADAQEFPARALSCLLTSAPAPARRPAT